MDHDLTLDVLSQLGEQNDPRRNIDFRTPRLELDNVYGAGPVVSPQLYDGSREGRLALGADGADLARTGQGLALIGDPRNDENMLLAQLHLAMISSTTGSPTCSSRGRSRTPSGRHCRRCRRTSRRRSSRECRSTSCWTCRTTSTRCSRPRGGWSAGTTSGSSCTSSCRASASPRSCGTSRRTGAGSSGRAARRSSRWSSPPRRSGSGTRRSAPPTGSTRTSPARSSRTTRTALAAAHRPAGGPVAPENAVDWRFFFQASKEIRPQTTRRLQASLNTQLLDLPVSAVPGAREGALARGVVRGGAVGLGCPSASVGGPRPRVGGEDVFKVGRGDLNVAIASEGRFERSKKLIA